MQKSEDRFLWVMFGGAVGDAMWVATEFLTPEKFGYVKDLQGRPKFRTSPGQRTDDTAMTLCLAQSLIDSHGFDIVDQLDKYLDWYANGYMSSTWRAFWVWSQTGRMLYDYKLYKEGKITHKPWEDDLSGRNKDGNWSIMKIGPVALFYCDNVDDALYYAWESVKPTHNSSICIDSARYLVGMIWGALAWASKSELLDENYSPIQNYRQEKPIDPSLSNVMAWSYKSKIDSEVWQKYWYVVDSLEVALWWFYHTSTFEEGLLRIINLWLDADTNGCIYGFLAWAYYGYDAIPQRRRDYVAKKELIRDITLKLFENHK